MVEVVFFEATLAIVGGTAAQGAFGTCANGAGAGFGQQVVGQVVGAADGFGGSGGGDGR